jgi:hypothetical protein
MTKRQTEVIFLRGGMDAFDMFDVFDDQEPVPELSDRDICAQVLTGLKAREEFKVGGQKWVVWRVTGGTVLMTKAGTAGKKLYQLVVAKLEPCLFEVYEVSPGSGTIFTPGQPTAEGPREW